MAQPGVMNIRTMMTSQDGIPVPGSCTFLCLLEAVICVLEAVDMLSPEYEHFDKR